MREGTTPFVLKHQFRVEDCQQFRTARKVTNEERSPENPITKQLDELTHPTLNRIIAIVGKVPDEE